MFSNRYLSSSGHLCIIFLAIILDDTDGVNKDGTKLQIGQCLRGTNQQWLLKEETLPDSIPIILEWNNHNKYLVSGLWFQLYANLFVNRTSLTARQQMGTNSKSSIAMKTTIINNGLPLISLSLLRLSFLD